MGRGLYRNPGAALTERSDLAVAARLVPGVVVCLLSALRFHGLTTQNPSEVWLAIDRKAWRPRAPHPPLRLVCLTGAPLREGVEEHDVGGVRLREYRRAHPQRLEVLWRFAEVDRVTRVMRPYLEAVG